MFVEHHKIKETGLYSMHINDVDFLNTLSQKYLKRPT